jgi:GT2 family glycosyltransferase/glycosyltransferase involved in cell wall biosynthesis
MNGAGRMNPNEPDLAATERRENPSEAALRQVLSVFFDAAWYTSRYPDVVGLGIDPLRHYMIHGAREMRDPNRWFDGAWYARHYADVGSTGVNPLLHYLQYGAAGLRNPHPRFDAVWYVDQHPEAAANPLLYHMQVGAVQGFLTEKPVRIADYLPSREAAPTAPAGLTVDIVVPVYKGLAETRQCLESVLADTERMPGRIIVIDDASPDADLSAWLRALATKRRIRLLRNRENLGFVASVNRGMREAGDHDVILLNSDTAVPVGWTLRLAAQAHSDPRIASVSPFSNNATICSYPNMGGGPMPFGRSTAEIDAVCQQVNVGRCVDVPTTVGFCMYIKRAALDALGEFDAAAFGRGYGEETDFCLRATARGWRHILACDVFVFHQGSVSFGAAMHDLIDKATETILARYPDYLHRVAWHARQDAAAPYRFAITAALFAAAGLPVILLLSPDLGGGVRRHIDLLVTRLAGRANFLLLTPTPRGIALSVPAAGEQPVLALASERLDDLCRALRSAGVSRVHVHHLSGLDVRALIQRLGIGFDLTVHDYFGICPQVNLLPWLDGGYCGEPGPAACNACIADRPSHAASDIIAWRLEHAWAFREADRVVCPSNDVRQRLARFGLTENMVVAPHEAVTGGAWPLRPVKPRGGVLRVAILGILAPHKGAAIVEAVTHAADPRTLTFTLIGDVEPSFPDDARERLRITGRYEEDALPALLREIRPHVLWFPATCPETYSFTLSTAIETGLPIVASTLGALPERLEGRPLTWLVPPALSATPWLAAFEAVRRALRDPVPRAGGRPVVTDFYADRYLATPSIRRSGDLIDLRRPNRTSVVAVPERFENGQVTPCGYIRLLLPLDHAAGEGGLDVVLADAASAKRYRADVIATQRYAIPDSAAADALAAHAKASGARLIYDLDDDLLHIPRDHPDADMLRPRARVVMRMLRHADRVVVSTPSLAASLRGVRDDAVVVGNALDERLWGLSPPARRDAPHQGPVRLLCMGTATHDADFALIQPALARLVETFHGRVRIDMLGFSSQTRLPEWVRRVTMPATAAQSYPAFVNWIADQPPWHMGLAPLLDTAFNRCKSPLKTLDYGALGLAVLASDGPVYKGSVADGPGGMLVRNTAEDWYVALCQLVRDNDRRRRMGQAAWEGYRSGGSLRALADTWRAGWFGHQERTGPATEAGPSPSAT